MPQTTHFEKLLLFNRGNFLNKSFKSFKESLLKFVFFRFFCVIFILFSKFFYLKCYFKGPLSGLRQYLATASPLKIMKNSFCFTSKTLFILKVLKFLFWLFGHAAKGFGWKDNISISWEIKIVKQRSLSVNYI